MAFSNVLPCADTESQFFITLWMIHGRIPVTWRLPWVRKLSQPTQSGCLRDELGKAQHCKHCDTHTSFCLTFCHRRTVRRAAAQAPKPSDKEPREIISPGGTNLKMLSTLEAPTPPEHIPVWALYRSRGGTWSPKETPHTEAPGQTTQELRATQQSLVKLEVNSPKQNST